MRNIFLACLLLIPGLILAQKTAHLDGTVDRAPTATPAVKVNPLFLGDDQSTNLPVKELKFTSDVKLDVPMEVTLSINGKSFAVWMEPGADLKADFKTNKENQLEAIYAGKTGPESTFLLQFATQFGKRYLHDSMKVKILATAIDPLEQELFENRKAEQAFLDASSKATAFSPAFLLYMKDQINYNYYRWLAAYPILRANENPKALEVQNLPRTIEKDLTQANLKNVVALPSISYREYAYYYITYMVSKDNGFKKFTDNNIALNKKQMFSTKNLTGQALNWYTTRIFVELLPGFAPGSIDRMRDIIKKGVMGDLYFKYAEKQVVKAEAVRKAEAKKKEDDKAKSGETFPVKMTGLDGKPVKFSDFKGKVVYIDYWASWCGPCRNEMPASKELHDRLAKRLGEKAMNDIVFLYISIDKTEEPWRAAITKMGLGGVQAFSSAEWPDYVGSVFSIPSIPRYMIMNKAGEMIELNAARPSSGAVIEDQLVNLLAK